MMRSALLFAALFLSITVVVNANNTYPSNLRPINGSMWPVGNIPISFDACFQYNYPVHANEWHIEITVRGPNGNVVHTATIPGFEANGPDQCYPVDGGSFQTDLPGAYTLTVETVYTQEVNQSDDITETEFQVYEPGGISGMKFNDINGNGTKDEGEEGLEGWTIRLDEGSTATTDENGNYIFTVEPGDYVVSEDQQSNWTQTYPASGTHSVTVLSGEILEGVDFGNVPDDGGITGKKFSDLNGNGQYDDGEPGLQGWTIRLDNGSTATTDENGSYTFTVPPGDYVVSEDQQSNWTQTYPASGTYSVTVEPGQILEAVDFGNVPDDGRITGKKFNDLNGNGQQDSGEPGLQGWVIKLDSGESATTDADGNYIITVKPGSYVVSEEQQSGWTQTYPTSGTHSVTVEPGQIVEAVNFGNTPNDGGITGEKYGDLNGNGKRDDGEPGLEGWTIKLDNGQSTTTDENGFYSFALQPGSYVVSEVQQAGWTQSYPASGTHSVTVEPGIYLEGIDFGNVPPPDSLIGRKYFDWNKNGEYDEDEVGLNGFVIELYDANNELVATQETQNDDINGDGEIDPVTESGWFSFKDLSPGTYTVKEVVPEGWEQTGPLPNFYYEVDVQPGQSYNILLFGNWWLFGIDFGDLPEPYVGSKPCPGGQCFPTIFPAGAGHLDQGPTLGTLRDPELNGISDLYASGDDTTGVDDEDGVQFIKFLPSASGEVEVTVNGAPADFPCWLSAWIDFDDDGAFAFGENIIFAQINAAGTYKFVFAVPNFVGGPGYARFRLSTDGLGVLTPTGIALDGEVEDYVGIGFDYGDANNDVNQNTPFPTGYPVKLVQDGARHIATPLTRLGDVITDFEMDGQPTQPSTGDDNDTRPDEDGIEYVDGATVAYRGPDPDNPNRIITIYGYTQQSQISFKPHATKNGLLNMWVDWNRDGDWDDPDEQMFDDEPIKSGPDFTTLTFTVPSDASLGWSYVRFRYSTITGLEVRGAAINGEVEDYLIAIDPPLDFGDLPDPYSTLAIDNGPKHYIGGYYLGEQIDAEYDGQPQTEALGDDNDGNDDEEGVNFLGSLVKSQDVDVEIVAHTPTGQNGFLNAWIDFNGDGSFDTSTETIINNVEISSDTYTYTISIPDSAVSGNTFARFRFSQLSGLGPDDNVGLSALLNSYGEVEDYQVTIDSLITSVDEPAFGAIPNEFKLHQNYPNPFNPVTTIVYDVAEQTHVKLDVYNVLGQKVASLVNEIKSPGSYRVEFGTQNLPSGIYFYKVEMQKYSKIMKMILLK